MAGQHRLSNSELVRSWLDAHAEEIDALLYGSVTFVFTNGVHPRVKFERSEQLDCTPTLGVQMD